MNRRDFFKYSAIASASFTVPPIFKEEPRNIEFFSTGLPEIDSLMGGGFHPGELILILGVSGSGKSAFVNTINKTNNIKVKEFKNINFPDRNIQSIDKSGYGYLFSEHESSHTDPLILPWEKRYRLARECREKALKYSEAYLWKITTLHKPMGNCNKVVIEDSYSIMRSADFVFTLKHGEVFLVKNRYGNCGKCSVKYNLEEDKITIKQI